MRVSTELVALCAGVVACSSGTEVNRAEISGRWSFTETLEDRVQGYRCDDSGTYEIRQVGDQFDGLYAQRGVCVTPQGRADNKDSGFVAAGRVIGKTIRFSVNDCDYSGTVSGQPAAALAGRGFCVLQDATHKISFAGSWQATR